MTVVHASPVEATEAGRSLKLVRVDDEPAVLRNFVVERPGGAVGGLRLPVNSAASGSAGRRIDTLDQPASDAESAQALDGVQILQIADIVGTGGAAVKEVVREPDGLAALFSHQRMHRLGRAEESLPRFGGNGRGQSRRAAAAVERIVTLPERAPLCVIRAANGPDPEPFGHLRSPHASLADADAQNTCAAGAAVRAGVAPANSTIGERKRFEQFPVVFEGSRGEAGDLALIVTAAQQDRVAVKRLGLEPGDLRR